MSAQNETFGAEEEEVAKKKRRKNRRPEKEKIAFAQELPRGYCDYRVFIDFLGFNVLPFVVRVDRLGFGRAGLSERRRVFFAENFYV